MPSDTKRRKLTKRLPTSEPSPDDYQMVIEWSPEDRCYLATLPAWQNAQTHGHSVAQAAKAG